jgi:hypothetical protein
VPEIILGGTKFNVGRLASAWQTFEIQPLLGPGVMELFRVFEALPKILDGGSVADMDAMALLPSVAPVIGSALSKIPPRDLRQLTETLLSATTVEIAGRSVNLVEVYAATMQGRTIDTWKLLFVALKENYPDFFGLFAAKGGSKAAASGSGASSTLGTSPPATA